MKLAPALLLLLLAAMLEVGGDALMRRGLFGAGPWTKAGFLAAGALVLAAYGLFVNLPAWDFGRLLGVYVVLFFVVAQMVNRVFFGVSPSLPVLLGGALILAGGAVMTLWRG